MANELVPSPGNLGVADSSNLNGVIFALEARTHTADPDGLGAGIYVSAAMHNNNARGVDLFVDTTSSATGTLVVKLQKQNPATGAWIDIAGATTTTINDPADEVVTVYPGIAETANVSVSDHLGLTWRVHATVATASVTFGVGAVYLE